MNKGVTVIPFDSKRVPFSKSVKGYHIDGLREYCDLQGIQYHEDDTSYILCIKILSYSDIVFLIETDNCYFFVPEQVSEYQISKLTQIEKRLTCFDIKIALVQDMNIESLPNEENNLTNLFSILKERVEIKEKTTNQ